MQFLPSPIRPARPWRFSPNLSAAQSQAEAARAKADAEATVSAIEARANAGVERLEEQLKGKARAESEAEVRVHAPTFLYQCWDWWISLVMLMVDGTRCAFFVTTVVHDDLSIVSKPRFRSGGRIAGLRTSCSSVPNICQRTAARIACFFPSLPFSEASQTPSTLTPTPALPPGCLCSVSALLPSGGMPPCSRNAAGSGVSLPGAARPGRGVSGEGKASLRRRRGRAKAGGGGRR